jgi:hypothetical protein
MSGFKERDATILAAALLFAGAAQAVEIRQFDKVDKQDQRAYVALLVQSAKKALIDQGRSDLAAQVDQLFTKTPSGDKMPLGMTEFERNLALARLSDLDRIAHDPNARRLEVEDAMYVTLEKNGITLPDSFFTAVSNFKPRFPPARP